MEFTEVELEKMLSIDHGGSDCWVSVEVPPDVVLDSDYDRGDAWAKLRNAVREQNR